MDIGGGHFVLGQKSVGQTSLIVATGSVDVI